MLLPTWTELVVSGLYYYWLVWPNLLAGTWATGEAHETCQYNTCTVCTYPRDVKPITYEIGYFKVKKVCLRGNRRKVSEAVGFLRINIFNFEISCEKIREL
jgi:hypothetical protein